MSQLTPIAAAVKQELALALEKEGSSLLELEEALSTLNTGDGVFKLAQLAPKMLEKSALFSIPIGPKEIGSLLEVPQNIGKHFVMGGALGGLAMDELSKSVGQNNDSLDSEREQVQRIRRLTANLRREHGLQ